MLGDAARLPVITGLGVVSALGSGPLTFWQALLSGQNGLTPVESFDTSAFAVHHGCQVADEDILVAPGAGRAAHLAWTAGEQALAQAGLGQAERNGLALCLGTTMGEAGWLEGWPVEAVRNGLDAQPTEQLLDSSPDFLACQTAALLRLKGRVVALAAACAAGNYAIGQAADMIRLGRAKRVLAGGTDAFSRTAFTGFARLGVLSPTYCRPFSADRDGIVLAEGAALLLVESLASAQARGATVLASIAGYGLSCDAYHIVSPQPKGEGALRAMQEALRDAHLDRSEVDYICAHGTGTPANDRAEVSAVQALFENQPVPMSSIKALTGHSLGAASAIEAVACVLMLQAQTIIPTWNFSHPDPETEWDFVPNQPRPARLDTILNNAYAFGGNNSTLVLRRAEL